MPKITHLFKTYFPETSGGLEEAIRQCGTHAVENGFEVEVVSVGPRNYTIDTPDGIKTRFYSKTFDLFSNPFSTDLARSFQEIIRNTDILHFHFPWPTIELLALCHHIEKPALVTFHCDIHKTQLLKRMYLPFIIQYLKKMDKICITNRGVLNSTPYLGQFKGKIEEIPLFVNENRFMNLPGPDLEIIDFVKKIKSYALFVGVLRWYKGLDILLDAAKKTDNHIVIVGKGPLYSRLKNRVEKESIKNVHLIGFQNDNNLKYLIKESRLIVLPSVTGAEAFGQILLEGLYFSKPLISTELGTGTSLVNKNNHTGLVVEPGSATALSHAMDKVFRDDRLYKHFSTNAFQYYAENFTARVQGDKYIRIYKSFLQF